jgi:hypothetical protein
MVHFDVVTSMGGTKATEVQDANPAEQTKTYTLNGTTWEED